MAPLAQQISDNKNGHIMNLTLVRYALTIFASLVCTSIYAVEIQVLSSGGFAQACKELAPEFQEQTGNILILTRGLSNGTSNDAIPMRLERGEDIDVVLMTGGSLDDLMTQGKLLAGSKVLLANSLIACAVKQGKPKPNISTAAKLKDALIEVKTMAHSNGASGEYIKNGLMTRLGIKDQMANKLKLTAIPVGEVIASGGSEIGCQQLSELKEIKGIEIIGLLPQELQLVTPLFGAIVARSKVPTQAKELLTFLSSPSNAHVLAGTGLTPVLQSN